MLRDGPLPGPVNMARDHALALSLPEDRAVLRLYRWVVPTLSFGRNEPTRDRYDPAAVRERGIDVVRRPTGGRAVLHDRELTYAVAVPLHALGGIRRTYVLLNRALRRGLASLGAPAEIAPGREGGRAPAPDAGPCFREPVEGEVVAGGRKLVGSAQARIGRALLQHGSILLADDQAVVAELASPGPDRSAPAPGGAATLEDVLDGPVPGWDVLSDAVTAGFREELGGRWTDEPPAPDAAEEARLEEMYRSEAWTWRR